MHQVSTVVLLLLFLILLIICLLGCTRSQLQHVESSSLTKYRTQAPCIGSVESQPLDHQGSSRWKIFFFLISRKTAKAKFGFLKHMQDSHTAFTVYKELYKSRDDKYWGGCTQITYNGYAIWYKGLEHSRILVCLRIGELNSPSKGTTVIATSRKKYI